MVYVMHEGNPKVVSLMAIREQNVITTSVAQKSATNPSIINHDLVVPAEGTYDQNSRRNKLITFFIQNIRYAFLNLSFEHMGLLAFVGLFAVMANGLSRIHVVTISRPVAIRYVLLGGMWVIMTILPFTLYGRFTAPPYVFVLPSIGAGVAFYGLYWVIMPTVLGHFLRAQLLKTMFCGLFGVFVLQQYGYFFGLKNELLYSRTLAKHIVPVKEELLRGVRIIVKGVPKKSHEHIFWLEKAVGHRAFISVLGDDFESVEIRYKSDGIIEIFIPAKITFLTEIIYIQADLNTKFNLDN